MIRPPCLAHKGYAPPEHNSGHTECKSPKIFDAWNYDAITFADRSEPAWREKYVPVGCGNPELSEGYMRFTICENVYSRSGERYQNLFRPVICLEHPGSDTKDYKTTQKLEIAGIVIYGNSGSRSCGSRITSGVASKKRNNNITKIWFP